MEENENNEGAVVLGEFEKNSKEVFRISISEFKGRNFLDIRVWYRNADGEFAPGKKGVAIPADKFDEFKEILLRSEEKIRG